MPASHGVACVIYAAKSTEDRRGSIPGQLAECRAAIAAHPGRSVVADYTDEAFSAFTANRGPGLAEAMAHAEDLAQEGVVAELWVQHSDRLARGDGHSARHTVEIALWALKRDVKICTLHDPDTFRDQHQRPEDACSASAARPSTVRVAGLSAEHGGLVEKQA